MRTACAEVVAMIDRCPSDLARDEPQNQNMQNAPENYRKQGIRLLQEIVSSENDQALRHDLDARKFYQEFDRSRERDEKIQLAQETLQLAQETLREQQDSIQSSVETLKKQMSDVQSLLKHFLRRFEQLSLPPNSQYTQGQGARTDPLSLSGPTQYAPAVRSEHLSYSGNAQYVLSLRYLRQLLTANR
jgi:hypothetical protein